MLPPIRMTRRVPAALALPAVCLLYAVTGRCDETRPAPPAATPWIKVVSPNGGETLRPGQMCAIRWQSGGVRSVRIELVRPFGPTVVISALTHNTGSSFWTVPAALAGGADYRIRVSALTPAGLVSDESDAPFTIAAALTVSQIVLQRPRGYEIWEHKETPDLLWTSVNVPENVNIRLFYGPVFHSIIASNIPNTGTFTWEIPEVLETGDAYKIRVESATRPDLVFAESAAVFSIVRKGERGR